MGRRRKERPLFCKPLIDSLLRAEQDIRRIAQEEREAFSYINARDYGKIAGQGCHSDRTAKAAEILAEGVPKIRLSDGRLLQEPEAWLACFDAVWERAKQCANPEVIFREWHMRYEKGSKYIGELITGVLDSKQPIDRLIMWIIYWTEAEAVKRGLITEERTSLYGQDTEILETGEPRKDL